MVSAMSISRTPVSLHRRASGGSPNPLISFSPPRLWGSKRPPPFGKPIRKGRELLPYLGLTFFRREQAAWIPQTRFGEQLLNLLGFAFNGSPIASLRVACSLHSPASLLPWLSRRDCTRTWQLLATGPTLIGAVPIFVVLARVPPFSCGLLGVFGRFSVCALV